MIENADSNEHPLGNIVRNFHTPINTTTGESAGPQTKKTPQALKKSAISLTPDNLRAPALLMDSHFRIIWHNQPAGIEIFQSIWDEAEDISKQSIFGWLCDARYQESVVNWRQWVRFFLQHASGLVSEDKLKENLSQLDRACKPILMEILESQNLAFERNVFSGRIRQVRANGSLASFWVVATDFDQGRLFVFDSLHPAVAEPGQAMAAEIEQKLEMVRQNPQQTMRSVIHLLAVRLHNADTLRTEMLVDEYARLLNRLWQRSIETIEKFGGMIVQDGDAGLLGYFLPSSERDTTPLYVIECALALKSQMVELGREWKIRKGWLHDLALNMGIHSQEEYLGLLRSSVGDSLTLFGRSLKVASHLAQMGTNGQIWTTKSLVNRLSPEALKSLRFGVFRQDKHRQVFISRCFSRLKDLSDAPEGVGVDPASAAMSTLAVTQVFDLQP